jgi:hypothetical protein
MDEETDASPAPAAFTIYQDKNIKLTADGICTIYCYYFPVGSSKSQPMDQVVRVLNGGDVPWGLFGTKTWGWSANLTYWACGPLFPLREFNPCSPNHVVLELVDGNRIGFSVADVQAVELLRAALSHQS